MMRKFNGLCVRLAPMFTAALAVVASAPACGGEESDPGSTLPETTSSGGSNSSSSGTSTTGIHLTTGAGGAMPTGTTGEGGTGAGECGGQAVEAEPVKVNLLLVIDRSGSMNDTATGFDADKWTSMVDSLNTALDGVSGMVSVGLQFFPDASVTDTEETGCAMPSASSVAVPIASGAAAVDAVKSALSDADNAPAGNTPAAAALELSHRYFTEGAGAELEGENYVLLALDGGPNCDESLTCESDSCTVNIDGDCPTLAGNCCGDGSVAAQNRSCLDSTGPESQVAALADAGITTFVVGIPGSEAYEDVLDALAEAGGAPTSTTSPKFYQVQDAEALSDTLASLTTNLVNSCELALASPPPDIGKVNVFVNDEPIARFDENGWDFDNPAAPKTVIIMGETCAQIESEGVQSVRVEYGCKTIEVPK